MTRVARHALAFVLVAAGWWSLTGSTAGAQEPVTGVRGELIDGEGQPVEGVDITVATADGEEVGQATSGDDGTWLIELPGAGTYDVTLDVDTLPDGVTLRDEDRATLQIRLRDGQLRPALFQLGERSAGASQSAAEELANLAADGVRLGVVLALSAVGLSLIYGVTGLTNFAHGELVTFGALVAFWFSAAGNGPDWPLVLAGVLAVVAGGGFGFVLDRGLFAPLRRRRTDNISLIVVTIGLSLVLRHLYVILFEADQQPFDEFTVQTGFDLGPISLVPKDYVVILLGCAALIAYGVLLQRTRLGTAMRAVADNGDLAEASGIDVGRVVLATWVIGAGLAAMGGVLKGVSESVVWDMGFNDLLLIFAAVVLGGIGTAYGAMAGGLVLGVATQVSTYWIEANLKIAVGLAVLIVVVLVRPQGIFGQAERVG